MNNADINSYKIQKYLGKLHNVNENHPSYQIYLSKYIYYLEGGIVSNTSVSKSVVSGLVNFFEKGTDRIKTKFNEQKEKLKAAYTAKIAKYKENLTKLIPGKDMQDTIKKFYAEAIKESENIQKQLLTLNPDAANLVKIENNQIKFNFNTDILKTIASKLITDKLATNKKFLEIKSQYDLALASIEKIKNIPNQIENFGDVINKSMENANILLSGISDISDPKNIDKLLKEITNINTIVGNPSSVGKKPTPLNVNSLVKSAQKIATAGLNSPLAKQFAASDPELEKMRKLAAKSVPVLTKKVNRALKNPQKALQELSNDPTAILRRNPSLALNLVVKSGL